MASLIRGVGLALITWSLFSARHHPGLGGRGLVNAVMFAAAVVSWLVWMVWPERERGVAPELFVMAGAGGVLVFASPESASSAFVFVAVAVVGVRAELARGIVVVAVGTVGVAISDLIYKGSALGLLAYGLGYSAVLLAASNARQSLLRAEQAELLLAQTQRSHEEQLRAARLEESARIAREIHDVLAHALAGLTIQLEATSALIEQGADRDALLARVNRAHELAREGLRETRRAVGALRGDPPSARIGIASLVDQFRSAGDTAAAELTVDGDETRLTGPVGEAVLRVVQEALTNARKHAPGATVSVDVHAGSEPGEEVVVHVEDRGGTPHASPALSASGGGFGLRGMRERAELLGGTLTAGPTAEGWQVELRLAPAGSSPPPRPAASASQFTERA